MKKVALSHVLLGMSMVWPLWKAVWRLLKKLNMEVPHYPAIPPLGLYLKELKTDTQNKY